MHTLNQIVLAIYTLEQRLWKRNILKKKIKICWKLNFLSHLCRKLELISRLQVIETQLWLFSEKGKC